MMYTLLTWEHENSEMQTREFENLSPAYILALKGGFYKSQIVNEFGVVEYEFKQ